jgi:hypothetical protein
VLDAKGVWMDPDMNNYDTEHVTTAHPLMSDDEFRETYRDAWHAFYTDDHMETVMRRAAASGMNPRKVMGLAMYFYGSQTIEGVHPLQGGLVRRKYRLDRRPGRPIENPIAFYAKYSWEMLVKGIRVYSMVRKYKSVCKSIQNDPNKENYTDLALTPSNEEELQTLEIFSATQSAKDAVTNRRPRRVPSISVAAAE